MLDLAFSQQKGCQNIYWKTGQYGNKVLKEISKKWERNILIDTECDGTKGSISKLKKTTRNMYLFDIQYKIWHERDAKKTQII